LSDRERREAVEHNVDLLGDVDPVVMGPPLAVKPRLDADATGESTRGPGATQRAPPDVSSVGLPESI
jgi:hypothetical protein